jgi:hypothetical protein
MEITMCFLLDEDFAWCLLQSVQRKSSHAGHQVADIDKQKRKFLSDISDMRKSLSDHLDEIEKQTVEEMVSVEQNLQVELKKTHKWFLDLASHSPAMREQLEHDISTIEYEIQVAEESEAELRQ